jgi:RHS repeat-associated protein
MKKKILLLWLLSLVLFNSVAVFGQKKENPEIPKDTTKNKPLTNAVNVSGLTDIKNLIPQLTPKSPNMAAMERLGSYEVNLFNGLPTIEIPIFVITAGNLSVPVKLSYHASGIKVTDVATFAGMGWNLTYGGAVTRQVKGLPDEINAGSLGKTIPVNVQAALGAPCYNEDVRFAFEQMASNNTDTERDLFSVSIPSKSNQFILRDTTNFQWLMPEPSKIKFKRATNFNNSNSYFELTDEGGNYYLFNQTEITTNIGITSWLLRKMQGKRPTDKILFDYYPVANFSSTHDIFETVTINDNPNGTVPSGILTTGTPLPNLVSVNNAVEQRLPKTIYFPLGKIQFVLDTADRLDGFGKALDKIEIYSYKDSTSTYELIKTFDLVHTYKERTDTSKVLFLSEVKLLDNTGAQISKYILDYDTTYALPGVQSKAKDYWGYYNGIANTSLIPTQTIPLNLGGSPTTITIGGGNRDTQEAYLRTWTLNKITYPTNGFTTFDFEANQYFDGTINKKVGGLRIKKIASFASDTAQAITKFYTYGQSEDGNGNLRTDLSLQYESKQKIFDYQAGNPPLFNYSYETRRYSSNLTGQLFPNEGSPVTYAYVTEYEDVLPHSNGKTVYEFREASDGKITLVNSAKFFIQSKHWNRGQLNRKRVYGQDNKIKYKEENTYQVIGNGTTSELCGRLVQAQNIYQNARPSNTACYSPSNDFDPNQIYYFEYGTCKLIRSETYIYDNTDTTKFVYKKSETDFDTTYFQPKEIRDYTSDGNIDLQRFRYVTDFSNLTSGLTGNALALYQMKVNNDMNTPIEVLAWRKNAADSEARILGGKFTNYQVLTFDSRKYLLPDNILLLEIPSFPSVFQSSFTVANVVSGSIVKDSHYASRIDFGNYDTYGQLLDYQLIGDSPTNFTYNTTFLDSVYHAYVISSTKNLGGTPALTTNFDYELPLVGIKRLTAPNALNTYFEYDTFGRLVRVRDHENNLTNNYSYQFGSTNFIRSSRMYKSGVSNANAENTFYAYVSTDFFDGLGRPIQKLGNEQAPDFKDIILSTQSYDAYGRVSDQIMTTPATNGAGTYVNNSKALAQVFYGDNAPYSAPSYETSPLNRTRSSFGIGNAWREAQKKVQYFDEVAGTDVKSYTVDSVGNITLNGTYPANSLYKKRIIDEQGNTTIEITDNQEKLIQKQQQNGSGWLTTYYISDDFGRVAAILQPEAFALNTNIAQNTTAWTGGVFFYKYDSRGRVTESHVSNGGFTYSIYDKLDRPVLSQDEYQRTNNLWSFRKYDAISRNIISGELTNTNSRSTIQGQFNSHAILNEQFDATKPQNRYYTDVSFPFTVDSSKAMLVNYYDTYTTWRPASYDYYPHFFTVTFPYLDARGLLTGIFKRNTENRELMIDVYYYDYKGRIKQLKRQSKVVSTNYQDNEIDFAGNLISSYRDYTNYTPSFVNVKKTYLYDHAGRKFQFIYSVPAVSTSLLVADYMYDNVGRLIRKKIKPLTNYEVPEVGIDYINRPPALQELYVQDIAQKAIVIDTGFVADANNPNLGTYLAQIDTTLSSGQIDALQTIDYEYNIRGGVNCINCKNHQVSLGNKQNDLFSMRLDYNEDNRYYDGNISKQIWKTPVVPKIQQYLYSYDASSRLTKAKYDGGNSGSNFSLDTVRYDKNGNILQLKRNTIDNLSYTYNGNQLLSVTDAGTSAGFNDGNTSGNDYEYWPNGSLKKDKNKGIDSIIYHSFLNKVSRVKFSNGNWINFYYDGTGTLLKRKLSNNTVWTYIDDLVIKNDTLYQINQDEGRVIYDIPTDKYTYEFDYRDHLGNLRVSFRDSLGTPVSGVYKPPVVVQANDYDPWGMVLDQISFVNNQNKVNNFDYSNRERQSEFGLNVMALGARMYDPAIGRFWSTDPLTDLQEGLSPYQYSFNNPIRFNDPDGLMGEGCCQSVIDFFAGAALTFIDNNSPVPTKLDDGGYRGSAYETGRKVGNYLSVASGVIQAVGGAIGTLGAGGAELATVGIATPIALPVGAAAVATTINGVATINKAISNLNSEGNGNKGESGNKNDGNQENNGTTTKKDRVKNQNSGEKAKNQYEGITKAQEAAKKQAKKEGLKQNKINSTQKSKQREKNEFKKVKTYEEGKDSFGY